MKKILIIAFKYSVFDSDPYLTNDLVNELVEQGNEVKVIAYGTGNKEVNKKGLSEIVISIESTVKYFKYFPAWFRLLKEMISIISSGYKFDHIVMFAPLIVMWPASLAVRFINSKVKTAVIFDIFPVHQVQISAFPSRLAFVGKLVEGTLLSGFNRVTAMGANNKTSIESYYSKFLSNTSVDVLPLWGRKNNCKNVSFNVNELKFIFGGQIIKGRDIDAMINYIDLLRENGLACTLDIFSSGVDFELLKEKYSGFIWLRFLKQIPRDEYAILLPTYHVGLIVTDRRVNLPTFPSKILDYVNSGLASYCIVEELSDLSTLAKTSKLVYLNNFDFSGEEVINTISFFKSLMLIPQIEVELECQKLIDYFSVEKAVARLIK